MKKRWIALAALILLLASSAAWKPAARRWKWFLIASNIYSDTLRRTHLTSSQIGGNTGGARRDLLEPTRVLETYQNYLKNSGLPSNAIHGKRILEIGPGDNIGVALKLIASGASQVVCVDRFIPLQDSEFHRALYRSLRDPLTDGEKWNYDAAIRITDSLQVNPARIQHLYGVDFAEAATTLGPQSFDWIVSNAVVQEIYDPDRAFRAMDRLLSPGGCMIHKIDLGDYGMFSNHGFHPLEFLTVPNLVYRFMTESSGQPNRRLVNYYRNKIKELGYTGNVQITSIVAPETRFPQERSVRAMGSTTRTTPLRRCAPFARSCSRGTGYCRMKTCW
jgi:SAM-dependent methyltransferase